MLEALGIQEQYYAGQSEKIILICLLRYQFLSNKSSFFRQRSSTIDMVVPLREKGPHQVSSRILTEYRSQWEDGESSKPKVILGVFLVFTHRIITRSIFQ